MAIEDDWRKVADDVDALPGQVAKAAGVRLRRELIAAARRDTGGDARLSGDRRGVRLGAAARVTERGDLTELIVRATPSSGPWLWVNSGTDPRRQGDGRHPGTPAKHTFDEVVEQILPQIEADLAQRFAAAILRG